MLSYEQDRSATGQIANKRIEQSTCASSGANVKGWAGRYTWALLEPAQGSYDFSHIDADLAALGGSCTRIIIQVASGGSASAIPNYICTGSPSTYGPTNVSGCTAGAWTMYSGVDATSAIWRPAVMARWAALFAALGAHYDGNANVEAISVDDESVQSANLDPGSDYTLAAQQAQWSTLETTAVAAMPHTSFILQINFVQPNVQATANVLQTAYSNRVAFGGPDIYGYSYCGNSPATNCDWGGGVYSASAGTTPGTDYRGQMPGIHAIQGPDLASYTPADIFQEADSVYQVNHMLWNYISGTGMGNWTGGSNSVLGTINSNPVSHTACPTAYASMGCNTN